ncbi:hypothetical protein FISHEDRAFT_69705 [Fistulina hepatica ATCC 64428]|uniref:Uncharacterized protein n=1 Tax=Fistulina hepatica ATCC 64428 TaxID=1128425 RepID=A0A0D7AL46_9AGAR|nr:hypothetical protein FISHEDRAFT_69705 [Fistulina hepatica ATCC 64428]
MIISSINALLVGYLLGDRRHNDSGCFHGTLGDVALIYAQGLAKHSPLLKGSLPYLRPFASDLADILYRYGFLTPPPVVNETMLFTTARLTLNDIALKLLTFWQDVLFVFALGMIVTILTIVVLKYATRPSTSAPSLSTYAVGDGATIPDNGSEDSDDGDDNNKHGGDPGMLINAAAASHDTTSEAHAEPSEDHGCADATNDGKPDDHADYYESLDKCITELSNSVEHSPTDASELESDAIVCVLSRTALLLSAVSEAWKIKQRENLYIERLESVSRNLRNYVDNTQILHQLFNNQDRETADTAGLSTVTAPASVSVEVQTETGISYTDAGCQSVSTYTDASIETTPTTCISYSDIASQTIAIAYADAAIETVSVPSNSCIDSQTTSECQDVSIYMDACIETTPTTYTSYSGIASQTIANVYADAAIETVSVPSNVYIDSQTTSESPCVSDACAAIEVLPTSAPFRVEMGSQTDASDISESESLSVGTTAGSFSPPTTPSSLSPAVPVSQSLQNRTRTRSRISPARRINHIPQPQPMWNKEVGINIGPRHVLVSPPVFQIPFYDPCMYPQGSLHPINTAPNLAPAPFRWTPKTKKIKKGKPAKAAIQIDAFSDPSTSRPTLDYSGYASTSRTTLDDFPSTSASLSINSSSGNTLALDDNPMPLPLPSQSVDVVPPEIIARRTGSLSPPPRRSRVAPLVRRASFSSLPSRRTLLTEILEQIRSDDILSSSNDTNSEPLARDTTPDCSGSSVADTASPPPEFDLTNSGGNGPPPDANVSVNSGSSSESNDTGSSDVLGSPQSSIPSSIDLEAPGRIASPQRPRHDVEAPVHRRRSVPPSTLRRVQRGIAFSTIHSWIGPASQSGPVTHNGSGGVPRREDHQTAASTPASRPVEQSRPSDIQQTRVESPSSGGIVPIPSAQSSPEARRRGRPPSARRQRQNLAALTQREEQPGSGTLHRPGAVTGQTRDPRHGSQQRDGRLLVQVQQHDRIEHVPARRRGPNGPSYSEIAARHRPSRPPRQAGHGN